MNDQTSKEEEAPGVTSEAEQAAKGAERRSAPVADAREITIAPSPTVALGDTSKVSEAAAVPEVLTLSKAVGGDPAPAGDWSKEMTQVGLGAADRALVAQPSGTLLGIAAIADPDIAVKQPSEPGVHPPQDPGAHLPRFDDNPLIAAFAPQRQRQRPPSVFEGFVPLGSPTRSLGEPVPPVLPEPALPMLRASVDGERAARHWRAPRRIAGLAAGCFGLAASLAVASQALTSPRAVQTGIVPPTSGAEALPAVPEAGNGAAPVARPPEGPAPPPAPPPETLDVAAEQEIPRESLLISRAQTRADAGVPTENVTEPEDSRPTPHGLERPVVAGAAPEHVSSDPSNPVLDAPQLERLFALETRSEAYRCSAGPAGEGQARERTLSAAARWREWRRAQQNGDVEAAHLTLCELGRVNPNDTRVPAELAALALRWGDARGAAEAARAGLLLKPEDAALQQLLGDALALLGDAAESRRLWLEPFGEDAASEQASEFFAQRGKAALERSDFARARTFFRRAVILSQGALRSSAGLGEALAGLGETRAAVAWAERAARAAPRDAKLQMAYGDALYRAGDMGSARRAWSAAAQLSPSPAIRRRLARGYL